jgi:hypothetical protein
MGASEVVFLYDEYASNDEAFEGKLTCPRIARKQRIKNRRWIRRRK